MYTKTFELSPKDRIRIAVNNYTVEGEVISANFYDRDGWYVEINKDLSTERNRPLHLSASNYGYWKQGQDGGKIEKINSSQLIIALKLYDENGVDNEQA